MTRFAIEIIEPDGTKTIHSGIDEQPIAFTTGRAARDASVLLSRLETDGRKYRVIQLPDVSEDADAWRGRELRRFQTGVYKEVPWAKCHWFRESKTAQAHFTHVSNQDNSKISFVENPEKGRADTRTLMRPGRYLARYFSMHLSEQDIQGIATAFDSIYVLPILQLATTADEIVEVYMKGPNSCMSAPPQNYACGGHPARVYAGGDLAIAYLKQAERITARTVVWPARKQYWDNGYGDMVRLRVALRNAGFSRTNNMTGARLQRIEKAGVFVMPYLDCAENLHDNGEFLIINNDGDIPPKRTDGLACINVTCDHCHQGHNEDNMSAVEDNYWCNICTENYADVCNSCNNLFPQDEMSHAPGNMNMFCANCYNEQFGECDSCGDVYRREDLISAGDATDRCPECHTDYEIAQSAEENERMAG